MNSLSRKYMRGFHPLFLILFVFVVRFQKIWTCATFGGFGVDGVGVKIVDNEDVLVATSRCDKEANGLIRVDLTG